MKKRRRERIQHGRQSIPEIREERGERSEERKNDIMRKKKYGGKMITTE